MILYECIDQNYLMGLMVKIAVGVAATELPFLRTATHNLSDLGLQVQIWVLFSQ